MGVLKKHGEMIAALTSGAVMAVAWGLESHNPQFAIILFLAAYIIGGYVKAKEGLLTLLKEREMDVNLLMFLAAIGAASIGHWLEGALLIFIFSLSGALESYTLAKSERELTSLLQLKPDQATRYRSPSEEEVIPARQLSVGDWVVVRSGERIPADGVVKKGKSSIDQATLTGESIPVEKQVGDDVFAGTLNQEGMLIVEVTQSHEDSLFSKIVRYMEETRADVPIKQRKIERFEKTYAKTVILVTLALMVIPHYLWGWSWSDSLYRSMVFLVVASPCALVASVMPALLSAVSKGARKGVLLKNGMHLEALSGVKVVAFDKTGTLTKGTPEVVDVVAFQEIETAQLIEAVGSIEYGSTHPLAKALVTYAQEQKVPLTPPEQYESLTGMGVTAKYQGVKWRVGKPDMFSLTKQEQVMVNNFRQQAKTVILAERGEQVVGLFTLQDQIREETKETIQWLNNQGIHTVMLTGDHHQTATMIGKQLGVDQVYSELLPQEKVQVIENLSQNVGKVAMIGDGVNDAPALIKAEVGISMGRVGSDIALDTADIVLMNDHLGRVPMLIDTSKKLQTVIKQNIIFALAVIGILIIANFSQMVTLPLGVIGHEGSTLLVILNGLRLLR